MFSEDFLHFIWQLQYYDRSELRTTDGQQVQVMKAGFWNRDAGPDFHQARVWLGEMDWNGQVELHLKSSDWYRHQHEKDPAYNGVVMHVVWEADREEVRRQDGTAIPQLELKDRVSLSLVDGYEHLVNQLIDVPCETHRQQIEPIKVQSMLDRVLVERLERKTRDVYGLLEKHAGNWDATAIHLLTRYFGFKKNEAGFQMLGDSLNYKVLQKIAFEREQVEAYLFGLSGLLPNKGTEGYVKKLKEHFIYQQHKFDLVVKKDLPTSWKFMRMRPANFPTLRIAQLAQILHHSPRLFAAFLEAPSVKSLKNLFKTGVSDYWQNHYRFGAETDKTKKKTLGVGSIEVLIINVVIPLLFAYGKRQMAPEVEEKAITLFRELTFEKNAVTARLLFLPVDERTAYESQAYLELYQQYCQGRRCLSCQIGFDLLKQTA